MQAAFIAGSARQGTSGQSGDVVNPATDEIVETYEYAGPADVQAAVHAARAAFGDWSTAAPVERSEALRKLAELMQARAEEYVAA